MTLVRPDGVRVDVTHHRHTTYEAMTPWSLDVDGRGRLTIGPGMGFEDGPFDRTSGRVAIVHGRYRSQHIGVSAVNFTIEDTTTRADGGP